MFSRLSQLFLFFLTSRFEGFLTATLLAVAQQLLSKGKKTLLLILSCFVLSILLTAGIIISTLEAAAQYDARGSIFFSALLTSSLLMSGISFLALTIIFWPRQPAGLILPTATAHTSSSPLEEILMAAMTEGMQYFKNKAQPKSRTRPTEYSRA